VETYKKFGKGRMDLRYSDVERALALAFGIQEGEIGLFRGRIRHLRKANVAGLPQTGTGRQIVYTIAHLRLLYLALRLNRLGVLPEVIGRYFRHNRGAIAGWFEAAASRPNEAFRAAISLATFGGHLPNGEVSAGSFAAWDVEGDANSNTFRPLVRRLLDDKDSPYIVVNVSAAERRLQDCLAQTVRTP
jgi:hypothetical protein